MAPSSARVLSSPAEHRIYCGSPSKCSKKRVTEVALTEATPLYRAKRLSLGSVDTNLAVGELLITHTNFSTEEDKFRVLQAAGCSEIVLVVEALILLEEKFNLEYESLLGLLEYRPTLELMLKELPKDCPHGFSRFCHGIVQAYVDANLHSTLKTVKQLYEDVCESVLVEHPYLTNICQWRPDVIAAWDALFRNKTKRHQKSHPFKLIDGDLDTAFCALAVLEHVQLSKKFDDMRCLIDVCIPMIHNVLEQGKKAHERESREVEEVKKSFWNLFTLIDIS